MKTQKNIFKFSFKMMKWKEIIFIFNFYLYVFSVFDGTRIEDILDCAGNRDCSNMTGTLDHLDGLEPLDYLDRVEIRDCPDMAGNAGPPGKRCRDLRSLLQD